MEVKMKYYWKITKVFIDSLSKEVGISCGDKSLKSNSKIFTMYDDDNNCYYQGMIYGDYTGFEPLNDFGMPNAGCTYIKMNGKEL